MEKSKQINQVLQQPKLLANLDAYTLQNWVKEYPYFQALQCVYLKKLFINDSFQYNMQLKKTAATTGNRSILFDFITSKEFAQQEIADQIREQQGQFEDNEDFGLGITATEAKEIADPDLFVPKPKNSKALNFSEDEKHSFHQWLQLTQVKPVQRKVEKSENKQKEEKEAEKSVSNPKMDKVDSFLKNNPKIKPTKNYSPKKEIKLKTSPSTQLMTETLARVYEEQKAYEKAIQAYKILILNNPEKNSFFATQIERLEQLLENNI
ncbi:hypothetical protein [Psychroflexus planctonicus]|uniref:Tetratricopeptide repeat-containing protein n=1 Tax=Psychroflexus planctonicus TaxID=1526575 RepID=A0ABQ1SFP7_9FLAO|nr:hypothetical protein [Psychroflexus planctonicus]GGE37339.1 hypothetical protein GCM10010832_16940 [Psychroflexus planctonicus]